MARQTVAISDKSGKKIQEAIDIIKAKASKRKIVGISIESGDLIIKHVPDSSA